MSYEKHAVEDYNTVNLTFRVNVNFDNKMYNNLILDVEAAPSQIKRVDNGFWSRRKTTIVDGLVLILLLLSLWTYILSVLKTSVLAKVSNVHITLHNYVYTYTYCFYRRTLSNPFFEGLVYFIVK